MEKISGVYRIRNKATGDFYIGSSKDIEHRWNQHKWPSEWTKQPNSRMYKDMAQYGLQNFSFEVIEETNNTREREQYFIDLLKPTYNDRRAKGCYKKDQKEYRKKYSQTKKGRDALRRATTKYHNQLCSYEGETLTLGTLYCRFRSQGIPHPCIEAKKYLIEQ